MNRKEEYQTLKEKLEKTPPALNTAVKRAQKKYNQNRLKKYFMYPLSAAAVLLFVFGMVVNQLPFSAVYAMGKIPIVRELTKAVAVSPALKAAVDNEYVQVLNMTQQKNGYTIKFEYMIVDSKQAYIFYKLEGEKYKDLFIEPEMVEVKKGELGKNYWVMATYQYEDQELTKEEKALKRSGYEKITLTLEDKDMPKELTFKCNIGRYSDIKTRSSDDRAPQYLETITMKVKLDDSIQVAPKIREIKQWVEVEGKRVFVDKVAVYPTQIRVHIKADPKSKMEVSSFSFFVEDDNGKRLGGKNFANGEESSRDFDGAETVSYTDENGCRVKAIASSGYWHDIDFKVYITTMHFDTRGGPPRATIDFKNKTAANLPKGVTMTQLEKNSDGNWELKFKVKIKGYREQNQVLTKWGSINEDGKEEYEVEEKTRWEIEWWDNWSNDDPKQPEVDEIEMTMIIKNYKQNKIQLEHYESFDYIMLDDPIGIAVKKVM